MAKKQTAEKLIDLPPSLAGTRFNDRPSPMRELMQKNPRITFGRVVMPYFFDLDPNKYTDITTNMLRAIKAEKIHPFLYGQSDFAVDRVVLPAREFRAIARSPRHLRAAIDSERFERNAMDTNIGRRTDRAAEEARVEMLKRLVKMEKVKEALTQERTTATTLAAQASHAGYAHVPFIDMLGMVTATHQVYFGTILQVTAREKGWTAEQHSLAQRALDVSLFMSGTERVGNFRGWLDLEVDYVTRRDDMFEDRIDKVAELVGPRIQLPGAELAG